MSAQILTQEDRDKAEDIKRLMLLLRRRIALSKETLMSEAKTLVDEHFTDFNKDVNPLKPAQLKSFEGVALSATAPADVINFVNHQASKDEKKGWAYKDLSKKVVEKVNQIKGRHPRTGSGTAGAKDEIVSEIMPALEDTPPERKAALAAWVKEQEQDIQMELLREFVSYFSTFYVLEGKELERTRKNKNP